MEARDVSEDQEFRANVGSVCKVLTESLKPHRKLRVVVSSYNPGTGEVVTRERILGALC